MRSIVKIRLIIGDRTSIKIKYVSEEPVIDVTVGNTTAWKGDQIELICKGTGIPVPSLAWLKGLSFVAGN